jgi:hypothetical protein
MSASAYAAEFEEIRHRRLRLEDGVSRSCRPRALIASKSILIERGKKGYL